MRLTDSIWSAGDLLRPKKNKNKTIEKSVGHRNLRQARATPHNWNGSRDVTDHVTTRFAICHFLKVLYCNPFSIYNRLRDIKPKHIEITTLTFHGHLTSWITWPFDFYWWSIGTEPLTVFEIFDPTRERRTHTHTHTNKHDVSPYLLA